MYLFDLLSAVGFFQYSNTSFVQNIIPLEFCSTEYSNSMHVCVPPYPIHYLNFPGDLNNVVTKSLIM